MRLGKPEAPPTKQPTQVLTGACFVPSNEGQVKPSLHEDETVRVLDCVLASVGAFDHRR